MTPFLRVASALLLGVAAPLAAARASRPTADEAPDALTLHLPFGGTLAPARGPEASDVDLSGVTFGEDDGLSFVRLDAPAGKGAPPATCVFPAGGVLSNAQGAVSFRVRFGQARAPRGRPPALLTLTDTNGGTWALRIAETDYTPAAAEDRKVRTDFPSAKDALEAGFRGELETDVGTIEQGPQPRATVSCGVRMQLFDRGIAGAADGAARVMDKGRWHHVVWTWRSVHHAIYVDGTRVGGGTALSRMEPIASDGAKLSLFPTGADVADLRVYARALDAPAAAALAEAGTDECLPEPDALRIWADWGHLNGRTIVYADAADPRIAAVKLACLRAGEGQPLAEATMTRLPSRLGEKLVSVTDPDYFPDGTYRYEAVALDADGREVARAATPDWSCELIDWHRKWMGSNAGLAEEPAILPPYTPVEVEGQSVNVMMRRHRLGETGLPESIVADEGELLDAPVAFRVRTGGEWIEFGDSQWIDRPAASDSGDAAQWTARSVSADGHALVVRGRMEYDGLATFDVSLEPNGTLEAEGIELLVPYREEAFKVVHSVGVTAKQHFGRLFRDADGKWATERTTWGKFRKDRPEGVLFDSFDADAGPAEYPYVSYLHVGNYHRGLAWCVDNDRNWVHAPKDTASVQLCGTDGGQFLRANLVARPTEIDAPTAYRFHLLANPFRPLPADWRTWSVANQGRGDNVDENSEHVWWWHWSEYAGGFQPFPGIGRPDDPDFGKSGGGGAHGLANDKTYADWVGAFKGDRVVHAPFINFGTPGGSGLYRPEMKVLPFTWKLHNTRPLQDYMTYWLDRCIKEIGIRGVYVDEPYVQPYSWNVLAGDAPYVRDDGTRGVGYRYMEGRDYFRRIRHMFVENGLDTGIWLHNTNYHVSPIETFVEIGMDGEHPSMWVPSFDNYHVFYRPTKSRGYLSGIPFGHVATMMYHGNTGPDDFAGIYRKTRTYLAVTFPYRVLPQTAGIQQELDRTNNIRYAFGLFDHDELSELELFEHETWLPGATIKPDGLYVSGIRHAAGRRALLYTSNRWGAAEYEFAGGFDSLDLGRAHNHAWNPENGVSMRVGERWVLDTAPSDFAMIWVAGADQPQTPRPDGAILGVSFDEGVAPDFGGGIAPVGVNPDDAAPEFVEGHAGKALRVAARTATVIYPVVPDWVAGSIELDLKVLSADARPLRLLALKHHLDVELHLVAREGRAGLLLRTMEGPPGEDGTAAPVQREAFAPLGGSDAWRRTTLVWRAGQYDLYVDGRSLASLIAPAGPRLRDRVALAEGVVVGPGEDAERTGAKAAVDSLIVYDWAMDAASAGQQREPMTAAKRPAPRDEFPVWVWGRKSEDFVFGVSLASHPAAGSATRVAFTLADSERPGTPIGKASVGVWRGTGVAANVPTAAAVDVASSGGLSLDSGGDDLLEGLDLDSRKLILTVKVFEKKKVIATRKVEITTGLDDPSGRY